METLLTNQWQTIVKLQFQWRNKPLDFTEADDYPVLINSQCSRKKGEVKTWHPDKLTSRLRLSLLLYIISLSVVLLHLSLGHACHIASTSFRTRVIPHVKRVTWHTS